MSSLISSPAHHEKSSLCMSVVSDEPAGRLPRVLKMLSRKPDISSQEAVAPIDIPLFLQAETPRDISSARTVLRPIDREYLRMWFHFSYVGAFMFYLGLQKKAPVQIPWMIGWALFIVGMFAVGYFLTRRRVRVVDSLLREGDIVHGRVTYLSRFVHTPWFIVEFYDRNGRIRRAKVAYHFDSGYYRPGAPALIAYNEKEPNRAAVIVRMAGRGLPLQAFPATMV